MSPPSEPCTPSCGLNSSSVLAPTRRCHAGAGAVLAARPRAAERLEVGARQDARDHLRADHVVRQRFVDLELRPRMIERIVARIARGERRRQLPLRGPVPIGQREIGLVREIAHDVFQRHQIGAMPRQEVPVAVRAEAGVDGGEAIPVARVGRRQRLHRRDRAAIRGEIGIVGAHAAHRAARADRALPDADPQRAEHRSAQRAGAAYERTSVQHETPTVPIRNGYRSGRPNPIQRALFFARVVIGRG